MTHPNEHPQNEQSKRPLDRAHERLRELAAAGVKRERLDPVEKARRNPTSRRLAIAAKCYDCSGGGIDPGVIGRIRDCAVPKCPLFPLRPYQTEADAEEGASE